jgi:sodium-dependent dicarboxylate transporter 2/3/5
MIAVSVASTCAFMTPVATPSNALAFGEMPGARLRAMLVLGAFLNVAGAVIMSAWLGFILPLVYG